ncbi:MAG: hypothetical protein HEEMFOPI_01570 [Holosporales bacterium]
MNIDHVHKILEENAFFAALDHIEKSRIVSCSDIIQKTAGETLYHNHEACDALYFVLSGTVEVVSKRHTKIVEAGSFVDLEPAFSAQNYTREAKIKEDAFICRIPSDIIQKLLKQDPEIANRLYLSHHNAHIKPNHIPQTTSVNLFKFILGWFLAFLVPIVCYHTLDQNLSFSVRMFLSVYASCVVLWMFGVTHQFVPGLLVIICVITMGLVPPEIALAGFMSDPYLLILSLSGIASVIMASGILFRFIAFVLNFAPLKQSWQVMVLFFTGVLMTPIVPSIVNRSKIMSLMLTDMIALLRLKKQSVLSTKFAAAAFFGCSSFSSIFVTGSIMNFTAFGLLPLQEKFHISSIGWTFASMLPAIVILIVNLFAFSLFFFTREEGTLSKDITSLNLKILGPLRKQEWEAVLCIIFFVVCLMFLSSKQIDVVLLSLFLFFALSAVGILSVKDWIKGTDWGFLLFMGTIIGLAKSMAYLGIGDYLKAGIVPIFNSFNNNVVIIISFFIFATLLVRLIMPIGPTFILMMTIGLPIAELYGISLWLIAFVLLVVCDIWFFEYQCPFYISFEEEFEDGIPYNKNTFMIFNQINNGARIASIYLAIPYWKLLGLM